MFRTLGQDDYAYIFGEDQAKSIFETYCWTVFFHPKESLPSKRVVEINTWCVEQFGPAAAHFADIRRWIDTYNGNYFFRSEDDAISFKFRWC